MTTVRSWPGWIKRTVFCHLYVMLELVPTRGMSTCLGCVSSASILIYTDFMGSAEALYLCLATTLKIGRLNDSREYGSTRISLKCQEDASYT